MPKNSFKHASESNTVISKTIVTAVSRILRPLIRLLISQGLGFSAFQELLKSAYVQVADEEFKLASKVQTDSRISLLTGVHRRDVKRLREDKSNFDEAVSQRVSLGSQIVALWLSDKRFLTKEGKAKPLARKANKAKGNSFEDLVLTISTDIRARVVLDDWLNLAVVHIDQDDNVCLNAEAFIPKKGLDEKAFYFALNIHDHLAAAAQNVMNINDRPFLERSVHYSKLSKDAIDELAQMAEEQGMQTLKSINQRAIELSQRDKDSHKAQYRFNMGVYCFYEQNKLGDDND